jgi:hypothetical protein
MKQAIQVPEAKTHEQAQVECKQELRTSASEQIPPGRAAMQEVQEAAYVEGNRNEGPTPRATIEVDRREEEAGSSEVAKPVQQLSAADRAQIRALLCPSTEPRPEPSPFLRLPGELRTRIYEYVIKTYRVEVVRTRPNGSEDHKPVFCRLSHRKLPVRNPATHAVPSSCSPPSPPLPLGLVFSCEKIYCETVLYLYTNTQFVFSSTKPMRDFLSRTPQKSLAMIRHLELNYDMYSEPQYTEFRVFKFRSDLAWHLACHRMSWALKSLRELYLNLTIRDWPIKLELYEQWALPALGFGEGRILDYVSVQLRARVSKQEQLQRVASMLEKAIKDPNLNPLLNPAFTPLVIQSRDQKYGPIPEETLDKVMRIKRRKPMTLRW